MENLNSIQDFKMEKKKLNVGLAISGVKGLKVLDETLAHPNVNLCIVFFNKFSNAFYSQIKTRCLKNEIKSFQTTKIKECKDSILSLNIDVLFVIGWRFKISSEFSKYFSKGIIVFHDSLLPKYRGFAPVFWALINGEKETGVSAFYIAEEIDSGKIIFQNKIPIKPVDDINTLTDKIVKEYRKIFNKIIKNLFNDKKMPSFPQDERQATYCIWRSPEDAKIQWQDNVEKINNLIRASKEPFFLAYTFFEGKKLYILEAEVSRHRKYVGSIPGRVESIERGIGVFVLGGDGLIKIKRAMLEGQQPKVAWEIINKITVHFE